MQNPFDKTGKSDEAILKKWQDRLSKARSKYQPELDLMVEREEIYRGTHKIDKVHGKTQKTQDAVIARNVVAEIIEAEVSSDIPTPKVTPRHEEDEQLAKTIEDYIRNEIDRLPFERLNDQDERTTPTHGGDLFLVEWDNTKRTHTTRGALSVTLLHPKQFIPQPGVYNIPDMDYFFIQLAQSKEYIKNKYGKDVSAEDEEQPDARGFEQSVVDDLVTENIGYFRNSDGGIGRVAWCNDVLLEYMEDYQARRIKTCSKCGADMQGDTCPYCGSKSGEQKTVKDFARTDENGIPMTKIVEDVQLDELGNPTVTQHEENDMIPYYKPDVYPVVLRRNVSVVGKLLGSSDVDMIRDQQMLINKLDSTISQKLLGGGSVITLPRGKQIRRTDENFKVFEIDSPEEKAMVDVLTLQPDISRDMAFEDSTYTAMRNLIGITDSFQGRKDSTATSGTAKQFAAAQTAGRLESRKVMKNAAYADLFEVMFKFLLAYSDEPRPMVYKDTNGTQMYGTFNKMDFLKVDEAGEPYWNDEFLFSVDQTAPLAGNRENLWQEARMNLENGCFGDPTDMQSLLTFWTIMEGLHYPLASEVKQQLSERLEQQQQMLAQQQAMMQPMATSADGIPDITQSGYVSPETMPSYQEGGGSRGMSNL